MSTREENAEVKRQLDKVQRALAYSDRTASEYKDGPDFETLIFLEDMKIALQCVPGFQWMVSRVTALLQESEFHLEERIPLTDPAMRLLYEYLLACDLHQFASVITRQLPKDPEYVNLDVFAKVVLKTRIIVKDAIESAGVHDFLAKNRDKIRLALQKHTRLELHNLQLMAASLDEEIQESVGRIATSLNTYLQPGGTMASTPPAAPPPPTFVYTTPVAPS